MNKLNSKLKKYKLFIDKELIKTAKCETLIKTDCNKTARLF